MNPDLPILHKFTYTEDKQKQRLRTKQAKATEELRPIPFFKFSLDDMGRPAKAKVNSGCKLLSFEELADWQQLDGELIRGGHRKATPSIEQCFHSWFYLHNESVNIFSHLSGAILFVILAALFYSSLDPVYASQSRGDILAIGIFMAGVATCFTLSAAFHTFACHSRHVYDTARAFDFQGIIFLVLCTTAPQVYYTFRGDANLQRNYWVVITGLGILASIVTLTPTFQKPEHQVVRVGVFAGLGMSTLAPIIHGLLVNGFAGQSQRFPIWAIIATHSFNIIGAAVYVTRFPERYWSDVFDLFGASHQLMHCAIVGAASSLLLGSVEAFRLAQSDPDF